MCIGGGGYVVTPVGALLNAGRSPTPSACRVPVARAQRCRTDPAEVMESVHQKPMKTSNFYQRLDIAKDPAWKGNGHSQVTL